MAETSFTISDLESVFLESPQNGREKLLQLKAEHQGEFLRQAIPFLELGVTNSFSQMILQLCREDALDVQHLLFTPDLLSLEEAARLLHISSKNNPRYQIHLISSVKSEIDKAGSGIPNRELTRLLEILAKSVDPELLGGMIAALCKHPDAQIRSKVALMVGSMVCKLGKCSGLLKDIDPRVRANAVEGLWGKRDPESLQLLKDSSLDSHHRVAANGLYGMYLGGDVAAIRGILRLSRETEPVRRLAGIWTIGQTGDPRFQMVVQENLCIQTGRARFSLLNAGRKIKKRMERLRQIAPLRPEVLHFEKLEKGRVRCTFILHRESGVRLKNDELLGTELIVQDGDLNVDQYHFEARGGESPTHVAFLIPMRAGMGSPFASLLACALEEAINKKRAHDHWAILKYGGELAPVAEEEGSAPSFLLLAEPLKTEQLNSVQAEPGNFDQCVERLVQNFPADSGHRQVVLLLDPGLEATWTFPEHWPGLLEQHGIVLHVICCGALEAEALQSWRMLCINRRGIFAAVSNLFELPAVVGRIASALASNFYLSYQLGRTLPNPDPLERLILEFIPAAGYGKITVRGDGGIELEDVDSGEPPEARR